jgi:hypothetical protein
VAAALLSAALLYHPARAGRRKKPVSRSLEHLRRLDAVGLRQLRAASQEMGRQVRHQIELTQINDYVESINQYTAGKFDACVMTNMDMLTIPAAGGVDSTALIVATTPMAMTAWC